MKLVNLDWNDFKQCISNKNLEIIYSYVLNNYSLTAFEGMSVKYECYLTESSDIDDFETNYKKDYNLNISSKLNYTPVKYYFDFIEKDLECNSSTWTSMYSISFQSIKYFRKLVINIGNKHNIKIDVDNNTVLETNIGGLEKLYSSNSGIDDCINLERKNNKEYILTLNMLGNSGTNVDIYQKRVTGTGDLKMNSLMLIYEG